MPTGSQYLRKNFPIGVPGPTRVSISFYSLVSMRSLLRGRAITRLGNSNHIETRHGPRPEEPCAARRLEGRPQARPTRVCILRDGATRLLKMRSAVGKLTA